MKSGSKILALGSVVVSIALIVAALVAVWLVPREALPTAAQGESTAAKTSEVAVRGVGSIPAKPDMLVINVGVSHQEKTVGEAQTKVTASVNSIVAKLKELGIAEKDYRTTQYMVEPILDYQSAEKGNASTPSLIGFRVVNMFEVTLRDTARAPELMDALVSAGANTVYGVNFTFSDPAALARQAYDDAVKDAAEKAERLASLSGLKLGKIKSVTEAAANVGGPVGEKGMAGGGGGFYPGQQTIQVDVIVTYEATNE